MDDAVGVGLGEPLGHLARQGDDAVQAEGALPEELRERPPLDQLHDDAVALLELQHVVDVDDRRMIEHGGGAGLAPEPPPELVLLHLVGANDLERHRALETLVPGTVDLSHAAAAEQFEHPEVGELPAGQRLAIRRHAGRIFRRQLADVGGAGTL